MIRKEKKSRKPLIIAMVIAGIMIFSVMGFIFGGNNQDSNSMSYNGMSFSREGSKWAAVINKNKVTFDYFPSEVEGINISSDIISRLAGSYEIDATYDQNSTSAEAIAYSQFELNNILGGNFNSYVRRGFTTNSSYALPVITCSDSTTAVPVVYFMESNETRVYSEGNCIIAEGKGYFDFIKIKDRMLYGVFNIIR